MKAAAVQMMAELGDVETNLKAAERLAVEAFRAGAELVIIPEFFTSAVAFHPIMFEAAMPLEGPAMEMLKKLACKHDGIIGGSFIAWRNGHCYNTFVLAFPDGTIHFHDKDQPTMWENCYYIGGKDDGVMETELGNIGAALCWEFIRTRTAKRMLGRVNLVVGGSCWWTIPDRRIRGLPEKAHEKNMKIMFDTPRRFAGMLGVPVVHAAHTGNFSARLPLVPGFKYRSYFLGETQIVDGNGQILARMSREDGEGYITADIEIGKKCEPVENIPKGFWIPDLPPQLKVAWRMQNMHGRRYYRKKTLKYLKKRFPVKN